MAALTAVHFAAHLTLGILDGDAALGVIDEDDEHHQSQHGHHQQDDPQPVDGLLHAEGDTLGPGTKCRQTG